MAKHILEFLWARFQGFFKCITKLLSQLIQVSSIDLTVVGIYLQITLVYKHVKICQIETETLQFRWIVEVLQWENLRLHALLELVKLDTNK